MNTLKETYVRPTLLVIGILSILAGMIYLDHKTTTESFKPLIVLTSSDSAPFSFYHNNELSGFDIDLIRLIGKKIGRNIQFSDTPFYLVFKKLNTFPVKKGDLAITAITATPERKVKVDLSIPYHTSYSVLLVAKSRSIRTEKDLDGKIIAVRKGSTQEIIAHKEWIPLKKNVQVCIFNTISSQEIDALKLDKIQAIALDYEEAQTYLEHENFLTAVPLKGTESNFSIALPKGSFWTNKVNQAIQELLDSGKIRRLEKKWLSGAFAFSRHSGDSSFY